MNNRTFHRYFYGDPPDGGKLLRTLFSPKTDRLLSLLVDAGGFCSAHLIAAEFGSDFVSELADAGVIQLRDDILFPGCPLFIKEDLPFLQTYAAEPAGIMAEKILAERSSYQKLLCRYGNEGRSAISLYHLLCGAVFDGLFFDELAADGTVAVSHAHRGGSEWLIILYEADPALDSFSRSLLCSYNRFVSGTYALQSFGDANGSRRDFWRFSRQMKQDPETLRNDPAFPIWSSLADPLVLPSETERLIRTGTCSNECLFLLEQFGYAENGRVTVPVFEADAENITASLAGFTSSLIISDVKEALSSRYQKKLFSSRFHLSSAKAANELYHILFARLNELLIASGFAASPVFRKGEGRYLCSVQLY